MDSVLAVLKDKKFQLSAVLLVRTDHGAIHIFDWLAASEQRRLGWWWFFGRSRVFDLAEREGEARARQFIEMCLAVAKEKSSLRMVGTNVHVEISGVKVEPFGAPEWGDWRRAGRTAYKRNQNRTTIEGSNLRAMLEVDRENDLVKCFYACFYMAWRWNFFPRTPEAEMKGMLHKAGARRVFDEIRAMPNVWRQQPSTESSRPTSPLLLPKIKGKDIFKP